MALLDWTNSENKHTIKKGEDRQKSFASQRCCNPATNEGPTAGATVLTCNTHHDTTTTIPVSPKLCFVNILTLYLLHQDIYKYHLLFVLNLFKYDDIGMILLKNQKVQGGHPLYRWGANREIPPLTLTSRSWQFQQLPKDIIPIYPENYKKETSLCWALF